MKVSLLLIISISIFALSACKKDRECETWVVSDDCTETGSCYYVGCNSYPTGIHQEEICGNALNNAMPNNIIVTTGNCTKRERTFLHKL